MAKLSMQIKAKDMSSGKTVTTSLANVNPEASDSDKLQTAIAMNALTSNLYSSTDLIKTINLDTETEAGKQTPTLTVALDTLSISTHLNNDGSTYRTALTYNGDGELFFGGWSVEAPGFFVTKSLYEGATYLKFARVQDTPVPCTFKVLATETATYKAAEITVTITA